LGSFLAGLTEEITRGLTGPTVRRWGRTALAGGMAFFRPENLDRAAEAGRSLRDAREVAGLTVKELAEALELQDESVLEAVEKGTATLSFELLLRLASLLARHDPVPFVMKYLRTYDPAVWQFLQDWGLGRLPLAYERERRFINIYRRRDEARALDEDAFERLLDLTDRAFALGLQELTQHRQLEEALQHTRAELDRERAELRRMRAELERARAAGATDAD
jgi:transcriptional regulator with XRE-family HTH domain